MTPKNTISTRSYGRGSARPVGEMRDMLDAWRRGEASMASALDVKVKTRGVALRTGPAFIQSGEVVLHDHNGFAVTVVVDVEIEPTPHVVITELCMRRREGGPGITARSWQAARLGEAGRYAIELLTVADEPKQHVVGAMRPAPKRDRQRLAVELQRTAAAYQQALTQGAPTRAAVQQALAKLRGVKSVTVQDAGNRIRQARKAGLIEPAGGTTRPKGTTS